MITVELARTLREAGLEWRPQRGDHFVVMDRDMDDEVFVLSDMTIEVHEFPTGPVIGFNGTVEWALDSLDKGDALWLPTEAQLRGLLGDAFRRLERVDGGWSVATGESDGERVEHAAEPAEAYGRALLRRLQSG